MDYPIGVDVSTWQGAMNWQTAWRAGARFAFMRVGSCNLVGGAMYTDNQWPNNAVGVRQWFTSIGGYWFFRPQWSAVTQANYFIDRIADYYGPVSSWTYGADFWGKYIIPAAHPAVKFRLWLDVETDGGRTPSQVTAAVVSFVTQVQIRTGCADLPGIYTRGELWNRITVSNPMFMRLPLWIARYTSRDHPWIDNPTLLKPRDWDDWRIWQWSADGNGRGAEFGAQSDSIDINYAQLDTTPPPPPEPDAELLALVAELAEAVDAASDAVAVTRERMIALQEYIAGG